MTALVVFTALLLSGCQADYAVYPTGDSGIYTCKRYTFESKTVRLCTNKEECIRACNEAIEKDK